MKESFDRIKLAISIAPILLILDPMKLFFVKIDASAIALGANFILEDCPIAFESKHLNLA